ncbi:MAG: ATP synthase gamma chain [Herpetosiphonaceae bacterium]|nr:MAG: ATP synthase gamma chain [Herpetosiphonaceae bacterium]
MWDVMGELTYRVVGGTQVHPLLAHRPEVRSVGLVLITPDRGLCGALPSNLNRTAARFLLEQQQQGRRTAVLTIGKKGRDFMVRAGQNLVAETIGLGDAPALVDILPIATNTIRGFSEGEFDEVYLIYAQFVNTLVQRPIRKRLLPVEPPGDFGTTKVDYTYEPDRESVLDALLPRFVEVQLYQAVLESIASEHSARMVAMRNANDNAKELVRDLTLFYNKTRQAVITKEISEIAAGATALAQG